MSLPDVLVEKFRENNDDWYVLARLALWAGDIDQALVWLGQLLEERGYPRSRYPPHREIDVVGSAASRLLRQATRLKNQTARVTASRTLERFSAQPTVITSDEWYVRATLWCLDLRRFAACVYLSDLKREHDFYRMIDELATDQNPAKSPGYGEEQPKGARIDRESEEEVVSDYSPTIAIEGPPFIEAKPSDFGTIEVELIWTQVALPGSQRQIIEPLSAFLASFASPKGRPS